MREDQIDTYVVIASGQTAVWLVSKQYIYHASVDGLRAVCNRAILVRENDCCGSEYDRSNSLMTCRKCADRVRRVKPQPREAVDVDAALQRHARRLRAYDER
jgi:hypothetical protein